MPPASLCQPWPEAYCGIALMPSLTVVSPVVPLYMSDANELVEPVWYVKPLPSFHWW